MARKRLRAGVLPKLATVKDGGIRFAVGSLSNLFIKLEDMLGDVEEDVYEAVEEELNDVLAEAREIVPYDTGRLHDSGFVEMEGEGLDLEAAVGFEAPYAIFVHENPDAYHVPPTQWKYLEVPWNRRRRGIVAAIARRVKEAVRASR